MEINFTKALFLLKKNLLKAIMRTFLFLFCALSFGFTPENGFSQNSKIKINSDVTLSVDEVFILIQQQTDYTFVYTSNLFKDSPKIDLEKGTIRTKRLLDKSLSHGDFAYDFIDNKTIILKLKDRGVKVVSEIEFASKFTDATIVGITGLL